MERKQLQLYIHIPFCIKKCRYCDFLSFPADEETQSAYVSALCKEIAYYGTKCDAYAVSTVYIGGGTPSWLREEAMDALLRTVSVSFHVRKDAEISIECNPGTITDRKFAIYRRAGINRLSIGLQSTRQDELKLLGRIHTYDQFLKTYDLARRNGFDNINVDLMNALPMQNAERFSESLQKVVRLKPEHISAYSLMIEKGTPFYDIYKFDAVKQKAGLMTAELPTEEEVYRMTKLTEQALAEAGYHHYEVSNFARPGFECRHNIGYWERVNYLGLGLGAASLMENIRYTNISELYPYLEGVKTLRAGIWQNDLTDENGNITGIEELPATNLHTSAEKITRKGQMEEFMFLGLRMIEGVSRERFEKTFGLPIEGVYQDVLLELIGEGLLQKREGRVFLTERGQDVSNYALAKFLLS